MLIFVKTKIISCRAFLEITVKMFRRFCPLFGRVFCCCTIRPPKLPVRYVYDFQFQKRLIFHACTLILCSTRPFCQLIIIPCCHLRIGTYVERQFFRLVSECFMAQVLDMMLRVSYYKPFMKATHTALVLGLAVSSKVYLVLAWSNESRHFFFKQKRTKRGTVTDMTSSPHSLTTTNQILCSDFKIPSVLTKGLKINPSQALQM